MTLLGGKLAYAKMVKEKRQGVFALKSASLLNYRANSKSRPDGKLITPMMFAEAKIVLAAFVDCCHKRTSLSAASCKPIPQRLPQMSGVCLVLAIIGAHKTPSLL